MDPLTILGIVGAGMSFGGGIGSLFGMSDASEERRRQAQLEMQVNNQRRQAMELSARRQQTENLRNVQLQRAMSLNSAVAQGAQFGTGLPGGQAQISGQGNWNALGINQNLEIGRNIFGLNDQISASKMAESSAMSQASMFQGISSLGGSLMNVSGKAGNLFGGFGKSTSSPMNFGPTYGEAIQAYGRGPIY